MKKYSRMSRVNELLKQEIADAIEKKIEHKKDCLISVTEVDTTQDLKQAKVYISIIGAEASRRVVFRALEKSRVFLQQSIAHDVKLKYTPVLEFVFDKRIEAGDRVLSIIKELETNE